MNFEVTSKENRKKAYQVFIQVVLLMSLFEQRLSFQML